MVIGTFQDPNYYQEKKEGSIPLWIDTNKLSSHTNAIPMSSEITIVSTPYIPGHKIIRNIGFTWGLIVRSRGLGGNIVAGLRTIMGGEIHEYTQLLNESRSHALERMKEHARDMGANAVIGVAFDSSEIGQSMTEVLAYGTAVLIEPDTEESKPVRLS